MQVLESCRSPVNGFHEVPHQTQFDVKGLQPDFVSLDHSWVLDILLPKCYILPARIPFSSNAVPLLGYPTRIRNTCILYISAAVPLNHLQITTEVLYFLYSMAFSSCFRLSLCLFHVDSLRYWNRRKTVYIVQKHSLKNRPQTQTQKRSLKTQFSKFLHPCGTWVTFTAFMRPSLSEQNTIITFLSEERLQLMMTLSIRSNCDIVF